ncbi:DUF4199 domain-containing protein [Acinetobacter bereziniae]|uniref:DUF4199 domain-containing protein n=1 Tax=Acinetobacter bereziniae LMG 1003 = CIP 70.12 TaxID=981324 RepID=N9ECF3_ACIBZ|nr:MULTISPECIES: DUF4199 domain-containing protein [Acinetobacter]ENV90388.1 hypothetical protein F938_03989 [Acinetobacter bereziniae LMG 1003 = CIP 70.12]MBJ9373844.1 DUF4199 domain-containing protein [Acinetobacter sp. TGL-Y2]MBJ9906272.1 DUF4199 domain-containing protein [Acinetobacter bereziniae]MBJ9930542.1 DUF4199 domain-containing protein [Acinetobacter bereziniae]MDG3558351.1 DUF4199 domain-containing protein [Acinetobacter bereziniae]
MSNDSNKLSPEKSFWGWKLLVIAIILSCIFMGIFYLAITNEPDYMPSQKQKAAEQHDMSKMSHEDMQNIQHSASEPKHNH